MSVACVKLHLWAIRESTNNGLDHWTGLMDWCFNFIVYIPGCRVVLVAVFMKMYPSEMPTWYIVHQSILK